MGRVGAVRMATECMRASRDCAYHCNKCAMSLLHLLLLLSKQILADKAFMRKSMRPSCLKTSKNCSRCWLCSRASG
jgi:hypothetical protein